MQKAGDTIQRMVMRRRRREESAHAPQRESAADAEECARDPRRGRARHRGIVKAVFAHLFDYQTENVLKSSSLHMLPIVATVDFWPVVKTFSPSVELCRVNQAWVIDFKCPQPLPVKEKSRTSPQGEGSILTIYIRGFKKGGSQLQQLSSSPSPKPGRSREGTCQPQGCNSW
ncbi:unnamed protein product [Pleuronectes platessa]|uniref:Uncharacterized protein n=1 Tax=Pleuronectes platessa TaxID=8262 RepID=A0A9N7Z1C7_PLEPL|nr:unnamed protein product [Pleuronectes platessa]